MPCTWCTAAARLGPLQTAPRGCPKGGWRRRLACCQAIESQAGASWLATLCTGKPALTSLQHRARGCAHCFAAAWGSGGGHCAAAAETPRGADCKLRRNLVSRRWKQTPKQCSMALELSTEHKYSAPRDTWCRMCRSGNQRGQRASCPCFQGQGRDGLTRQQQGSAQ